MNTKIYVDNVAVTTTESELMDLFSTYGDVADINIVVDRTSQKPGGFGFVTMVTPESARVAIRALNGKVMGVDALTVSEGWADEEDGNSPGASRKSRRRSSSLC